MHFCYYGWHFGQWSPEAAETFSPAREGLRNDSVPEGLGESKLLQGELRG